MQHHVRAAALGRSGEQIAALWYAAEGFTILARRFRVARGEVDLVARRGPLLVFVEVKTRRGDGWGAPAAAVDARKLLRLRIAARAWLAANASRDTAEFRFDVVAVRFAPGGDGLRLEVTAGVF
ncbi:MAG: YraN family protein [Candidatus Latescibacteria bacterium]|nr:YraN family protein [Candidatus Latescibacterota bacterium]